MGRYPARQMDGMIVQVIVLFLPRRQIDAESTNNKIISFQLSRRKAGIPIGSILTTGEELDQERQTSAADRREHDWNEHRYVRWRDLTDELARSLFWKICHLRRGHRSNCFLRVMSLARELARILIIKTIRPKNERTVYWHNCVIT